ncbi:MAG: hypothetical protein CMM77_07890 [Rhodospirillaceae bacterium]|nr:hypothetical protein [Rhodospirillaceae bacterium]
MHPSCVVLPRAVKGLGCKGLKTFQVFGKKRFKFRRRLVQQRQMLKGPHHGQTRFGRMHGQAGDDAPFGIADRYSHTDQAQGVFLIVGGVTAAPDGGQFVLQPIGVGDRAIGQLGHRQHAQKAAPFTSRQIGQQQFSDTGRV